MLFILAIHSAGFTLFHIYLYDSCTFGMLTVPAVMSLALCQASLPLKVVFIANLVD